MVTVIILTVIIAVGLAWLRFATLIATVSGRSMQPAYQPGEHVFAVRRPRRIRAGEVVLLPAPDGSTPSLVMKRVAATGGDLVPPTDPPVGAGTREVPAGHLVLLGDHPEASNDSRHWGF